MFLPNKGVSFDRALVSVGAEILSVLRSPMSVSALWDVFNRARRRAVRAELITFDWFSLALASLFSMGIVEWTEGGYLGRVDVH